MNVNNLVNHLSKYSFVALLTAGIVLSGIARIFFEGTFGTKVTSIIAIVICLVSLAMYAYMVGRDNTGLHNPDNLYYMGLLFTLASLAYSLVTLFLLTGNDSNIAERTYNLIGSFGIALISTFFGILFRILLLQKLDSDNVSLSNEPGESGRLVPHGQDVFDPQRQSVHVDLADAAFRLRRELTQTIADMSVFRGAIVQATHETVDEASKACAVLTQRVEETVNEQTRILSTLATTTADKLTATFTKIATSAENVQESLNDLADKQVQRVEETVNEQTRILSTLATTTADKLTATFTKIATSAENVQESLNDLADKQVQRVEETVNEQTRILSTLATTTADKLTATFTKIATSAENVQESLNDLADKQVQRVEETVNEQTRILSTLATTTADKLTATFTKIATSAENVQESLNDLADKQVQRTQQAIDLTEKSTRELENGMQNSLRQIGQSTAEIATTFDTMLTPLQGIVGDLQSTSDNTQNIFNQYASLNSALQQSLTFFTNIENQIAQSANTLTVATEAFSGSLAEATQVTPQYTQQFEQLIMTLRQEAEQWQTMTQEVRSSLVQAIDELTQLVKRS